MYIYMNVYKKKQVSVERNWIKEWHICGRVYFKVYQKSCLVFVVVLLCWITQ
jgi:hypothetical protein